MNHKRRRAPKQRGRRCLCHGMAKKMGKGRPHSASSMRLRERAEEAA